MRIVAYDGTKEDEERIVAEQLEEGYFLVEIQNITEGNYLGFAESPLRPSDPEESELGKVQASILELESRTKLLEYNTQNMGDTLDVHEGAIVDVMNLALGTSPNEL